MPITKNNTKNTKNNTNIDNCEEPCSPTQLKYFIGDGGC